MNSAVTLFTFEDHLVRTTIDEKELYPVQPLYRNCALREGWGV